MHTSALGDRDGLYQINSGKNRRTFLKTLAASGAGIAGIQLATKEAFGEEPDGVPIVWRRDKYGNPETIRFIPKERKRRINVYYNFDTSIFHNKVDGINGFTMVELSDEPTDLGIKVFVDNKTSEVERSLPESVQEVPVVIEERDVESNQHACDKFTTNYFDPLPANVEVIAEYSDGSTESSTLGIVCWNDNSDNAYKCYIAAAHGFYSNDLDEWSDYLHQSGEDDDGNYVEMERSGVYVEHDSDMDAVKYRRNSGTASADIRANASDKLKDLSGTWDYQGLTDATSGTDTVGAEMAGATNCYVDTYCHDTEKDATSSVYYGAIFDDGGDGGDSGGPYVDSDGYLIALHHSDWGTDDKLGAVGGEVLDSVNAQLYDPTLSTSDM